MFHPWMIRLVLLMKACLFIPLSSSATGAELRLLGRDQALISGVIEPGDASKLESLLSVHRPSVVFVRSGGGDVRAAIEMGLLLRSLGAHVVVRDICLSSCANYLFSLASAKSVEPGALLGFHGGVGGGAPSEGALKLLPSGTRLSLPQSGTASEDEFYRQAVLQLLAELPAAVRGSVSAEDLISRLLEDRRTLVDLEARALRIAGVSRDLLLLSGLVTAGEPKAICETYDVSAKGDSEVRCHTVRKSRHDFWLPCGKTLRALGVRGLVGVANELSPQLLRERALDFGLDPERLLLSCHDR